MSGNNLERSTLATDVVGTPSDNVIENPAEQIFILQQHIEYLQAELNKAKNPVSSLSAPTLNVVPSSQPEHSLIPPTITTTHINLQTTQANQNKQPFTYSAPPIVHTSPMTLPHQQSSHTPYPAYPQFMPYYAYNPHSPNTSLPIPANSFNTIAASMPPFYTTSANAQYPSLSHNFVMTTIPTPTSLPIPIIDLETDKGKNVEGKMTRGTERDIQVLKEAVAKLVNAKDRPSIEFEELCVRPDIDFPVGYKAPKFDPYNGTGNPIAHLKIFCEKAGGNEGIRMKLFMRSLSGDALTWYIDQDPRKWSTWGDMVKAFLDRFSFNIEIPVDVFSLRNLAKKSTETFKEYAIRWRSEAAKVQPPMTETMIVKYFLDSLHGIYFDRLYDKGSHKFAELVKLGEDLESGLKSGRILNPSGFQDKSGNYNKKREKEAANVSATNNKKPYFGSNQPNHPTSQNQQTTHFPQISNFHQTPTLPILHTQPPFLQAPQTQFPQASQQYPYQPYPCIYPQPLQPVMQSYSTYPQPHYPSYPQHPRPPQIKNPAPQNRLPGLKNNAEKKPARVYTQFREPYSLIFEKLRNQGILKPIPDNTPTNPRPVWFQADKFCAFHSGAAGHDIENCHTLKDKLEDMIAKGVIGINATPNVNNNPLPNHNGPQVNMISLDEDICLEGTIVPVDESKCAAILFEIKEESSTTPVFAIREPVIFDVVPPQIQLPVISESTYSNKEVPWSYPSEGNVGRSLVCDASIVQGMTKSGRCCGPDDAMLGDEITRKRLVAIAADEFWKKMQSEYSVVEQLKRMPSHITIMSLLMSSEVHRNALMKVLSEVQIPVETSSDNLAAMVSQVLESPKISFFNDELPPEGLSHNRALHITIKCRDKFVGRVLIDNGSGLNICPLVTLKKLGLDAEKLRVSDIQVRAFDGIKRNVIGELDLEVQVGPKMFTIEFQVMDISSTYNLLLGRPWIHAAGAIPSTLHQSVKFVSDKQEIVVHGESGSSSHHSYAIPTIEGIHEINGTNFHMIDLVNTIKMPGEFSLPSPWVMITSELIRNGFCPGRGLGKNLNGIVKPIEFKSKHDTFGLGYVPAPEEVKGIQEGKRIARDTLPKPIPPIFHSFVPQLLEQSEIMDVQYFGQNGDIIMGDLEKLFLEESNDCLMILDEHDDGELQTIWDAKPEEQLQNWTSLPTITCQELW